MNRDVAEPPGPAAGDDEPDDNGPVPPLLAASWQQAEARLYPIVTERPDLYERAVRLVRGTADHLRLLGAGTGALVAASERGAELVAAVAGDRGIGSAELDLDLVARAALAQRYRELRGEQAARRRLRGIEDARRAGREWAVLDETGAPEGDPYVPYSRLEVAVATGHALLVTATPDDAYRTAQHQVRRARLDLSTGEIVDAGADITTYPDATARDAGAARLRGEPGAS